MSTIFVAGAGTDVGKTYVSTALIEALRAAGRPVGALKPVISGFDETNWAGSDSGRLITALGQPLDGANLARISPFRFAAPLAADAAARAQGETLQLADLVAVCRAAEAIMGDDLLLIEGAGGVMSPIAERATNLDLIAALGAPVLLVGGNYLGAISHVLTAAEVVQARGLYLAGVVLSETTPIPRLADNAAAVREFLQGAPVFEAAEGTTEWAAQLAKLIQ